MTQHTLEIEIGFAAEDGRENVNSSSDFGLRACSELGRETESAKGKKKSD